MASAKFLEEALSTDVDESAVSAIVGSLENQLVTSSSTPHHNQNGTAATTVVPNGEPATTTGATTTIAPNNTVATEQPLKIVYTTQQQQPTAAPLQRALANGAMPPQNKAVVIKGTAAGAAGLVMGPTTANNVGTPSTVQSPILSNLQVVNVRPGVPSAQHQQKGQTARVVLSAPQIVGARPGAPQLTLQTFTGLQPGQQGHLLVKTENGQLQLLRVGPPPATANLTTATTPGGQPVALRMQQVAATPASSAATSPASSVVGATTTVSINQQQQQQHQTVATTTVQRPANDNTKEKCRKFLANLLELSSKEPKSVERSVRTLIQELIDMKVEPEDFCDKLERLLNASPQPCLIGFLKKSLPLLRHSLVTKELTIDGIRPPPPSIVFSIGGATPTVQTATVRPGLASAAAGQVRLVPPGATVVRPGHVLQQRLVAPMVRGTAAGQQGPRMVTTIRQPGGVGGGAGTGNVIVSTSQPPALHPVFPGNQVRAGGGVLRQPVQNKSQLTAVKHQGIKPAVPSTLSTRPNANAKEKKSFSSSFSSGGGAGGGDDDINDVAAMGGVNLAEETQKILGSTEFVGTQIRSCKEESLLALNPLQQRIRQIVAKSGLDEPSAEVAACLSHAAQERLKNMIEKLSVIAEHRMEMVKIDQRYEATNDVKGQLKFLEEVDRAERKRHEEIEREMLLRAAKSRSKTEDPEQAKLKAKAKEMQRVEMEELRQREANATALQAIGPRKKPRLDGEPQTNVSQTGSVNPSNVSGTPTRGQLPLRQRMKKVTLRDLQFLFETEKDLCKSKLLFQSYLK